MYGKGEEVAVNAGRGEAPTTWEKSAIALGPSEHMINERGISSPTKGVVESTERTSHRNAMQPVSHECTTRSGWNSELSKPSGGY